VLDGHDWNCVDESYRLIDIEIFIFYPREINIFFSCATSRANNPRIGERINSQQTSVTRVGATHANKNFFRAGKAAPQLNEFFAVRLTTSHNSKPAEQYSQRHQSLGAGSGPKY
jgi:hypothetical protein